MRPLLRPGTHVLRRRDDRLQVGLYAERAVVLDDTPRVRAALHAITTGALVDDQELLSSLAPVLAPERRALRGRVAVTTFGHPASTALGADLRDLLTALGLDPGATVVDVAVVVGVGEPSRALLDHWARAGVPHLLVRIVEGVVTVGPFVVPGVTACVRCADAVATDGDSSWPLLLEQYVRLSSRDRADGATEPVDPALARLATAWAARDVASYLQRHRPSTWSATVRLDPLLHGITTTELLRHPECGCTWTMTG